MSLIVSEESGSKIAPIEEGTYPAVCYGVVDLGQQFSEIYEKASPKVLIMWELPAETIETANGIETRVLSAQYTASLNEKSTLRKTLEAWRGKAFSAEELKGFSLKSVIGAPCLLSVIHQEKSTGGKYAKVNAVMKLTKGMTVTGNREKVLFDFDSTTWSAELEDLPEWIAEKVKASETYKTLVCDALASDEGFEAYTDDIPFGS